ncbi:DUF7210 family protein [Fusobacterium gastrosuis]|uniref:DUF7210 family protein n=1 Tax=Fusobacterium gastrosuis TaxID=1755100 RepID=UPI0029770377|nr:hypothetical protein [Fusobacteriaceae bacterium]MDY5713643.1 hypothetical protein [Fusobacterium gastrosuis]
MKVKVLKGSTITHNGVSYSTDEIFELDEIAANRLIDLKVVEVFETSEIKEEIIEKEEIEEEEKPKTTKKGKK